ncbi:MAG: hypothetical protein PVS3B3_10250 [Ktedonobacteraceae bacterium]
MNFRWITLTILVLLVLGGFISNIYAGAIERGLTLPVAHGQGNIQTLPTTSSLASTAQGMGQVPVNVLAHDTFQRANQALWGTAADGRMWQGDANTVTIFSITGGMGQVADGQGAFNAVLGPISSNTDVEVSAIADRFDAGKVNVGAVVRWTNTNNWYKALIDGSHLSLIKHVQGVGTSLASVPFLAQGGISYTLRIRALGTTFFAKVWPTATPEPPAWLITTTDTSLASGLGGIRIVVQNDTVVRVSAFLETTAHTAM